MQLKKSSLPERLGQRKVVQLGHTIVRKYLRDRVSIDPNSEVKDLLTKIARPQLLSDSHLVTSLRRALSSRCTEEYLSCLGCMLAPACSATSALIQLRFFGRSFRKVSSKGHCGQEGGSCNEVG